MNTQEHLRGTKRIAENGVGKRNRSVYQKEMVVEEGMERATKMSKSGEDTETAVPRETKKAKEECWQ